jgi:PhnB protein
MQVQAYLFLNGRCDEAIDFYKLALGAEVMSLMRFRDAPDPDEHGPERPGGDKVMHASLRVGDTTLLMSDGSAQGAPKFEGFSLALNLQSEADAERLFAALAEGGRIQMPLARTFFAPRFGMLTDRFGISWMIHVPPASE